MSSPQPTLRSLAATISDLAETITLRLENNGHPAPSFAEDSLPGYPTDPEIADARLRMQQALDDMQHLVYGANDEILSQTTINAYNNMAFDVLNQFQFFSAVPLGGSASYSEIAQKTALPEASVRRVLQYAFTAKLFKESPPHSGRIAHTALTAHMAKNPLLQSFTSHILEEIAPGLMAMPEVFRRYTKDGRLSEEPTESAFAVADVAKTGKQISFWDYLGVNNKKGEEDGFRAKRFAEFMKVVSLSSPLGIDKVLESGFDWASLEEATIIDVGGSSGNDSVMLARLFPRLTFITQDLPDLQKSFMSYIPQDLQSRITFQAHDFFTRQKTQADVFLLKMVLHDWPDQYAAKILQNLIPALKPGGRIILCDSVAPPVQVVSQLPTQHQRLISIADLQMFTIFNSLERTQANWESLLQKTDPRLKIKKVQSFPATLWSVIEVTME